MGSDSAMLAIASGYKNCLTRNDSFEGRPLSGNSTCDLPVLSSDGSREAYVLYLFDSHAENPYWKTYSAGYQYDCLKPDQVAWYCSRSEAHRVHSEWIGLGGAAFPFRRAANCLW